MKSARYPTSTSQRVKVGLIGLVAVVLLIVVASAIIGSASREQPIVTAGAAQPDVVATMAAGNSVGASAEPMAELGVAPATTNTASAALK
jgi:hypothetical protein